MFSIKCMCGLFVAVGTAFFTFDESLAADIQVMPAGNGSPAVIVLSGDIVEGDAEKFSRLSANIPSAVVFLESNGGEIIPAMEIGKSIRLRDYPTAVYKGSSCASACALVWIAGSRRRIYDGGRVGFHASYKDMGGKLIEVGVGNALVGHYLSQLGFGQAAAIFVTSAPPERISWLTETNRAESGISFESLQVDSGRKSLSGTPELSELMGATPQNVPRAAFDSKSGRNVGYFARALTDAGYKAQLDNSNPKSPGIITGTQGNKILLSFSSCIDMDCNYLEIMGTWTGVSQQSANEAFKKFALDENYSSIVYQAGSKELYVYHYVIIGSDGISSKNLMENLEYFSRDFSKVGQILVEAK